MNIEQSFVQFAIYVSLLPGGVLVTTRTGDKPISLQERVGVLEIAKQSILRNREFEATEETDGENIKHVIAFMKKYIAEYEGRNKSE